jgi:septum formation protein
LLEKIGLKFTVDPSELQEHRHPGLKPEGLVKALSLEKACTIAQKHPDAIIIAGDTIGVIKNKIIGKPHTEEDAREMLMMLSGKSHRVITGLTILDTTSKKVKTCVVETRVYFKDLSLMEIANYVKTGEPLDKAGAYAIQGLGSVIVEKINGDYYNVVGLPLNALVENLKEFGINVI